MKYEREILSLCYFKKFKRPDKIINVQPVAVRSIIYTLYILYFYMKLFSRSIFQLLFRILSIAFTFSHKFSVPEEIGYLLTILNKNKKFRNVLQIISSFKQHLKKNI